MDLEDIETVRDRLQFRGAQGTTGSQATFLELFNGDADKITKLNEVRRNQQIFFSPADDPPLDSLQEGGIPVHVRHLHADLYQEGEFSSSLCFKCVICLLRVG